jgi:hypothetical protein
VGYLRLGILEGFCGFLWIQFKKRKSNFGVVVIEFYNDGIRYGLNYIFDR